MTQPALTSLPAVVGDRQLAALWSDLCEERRRSAALLVLLAEHVAHAVPCDYRTGFCVVHLSPEPCLVARTRAAIGGT